jgi:hypothetical protein
MDEKATRSMKAILRQDGKLERGILAGCNKLDWINLKQEASLAAFTLAPTPRLVNLRLVTKSKSRDLCCLGMVISASVILAPFTGLRLAKADWVFAGVEALEAV